MLQKNVLIHIISIIIDTLINICVLLASVLLVIIISYNKNKNYTSISTRLQKINVNNLIECKINTSVMFEKDVHSESEMQNTTARHK